MADLKPRKKTKYLSEPEGRLAPLEQVIVV